MTTRISTATRYAQLVNDMKTNMNNFHKLKSQLSSGKKYTSITENPIAAVNIVNTTRQLGQIETFEQNVSLASTELNALDDIMTLATGYLSTAWDKATQANNQTYGKNSLKALKTEIDEITKTMVDLANTEYNDNYLFSGANSKTVAFTIDEETGEVIYNGTPHDNPDYIRQTEVADGVFETINTTGDKVFGMYTYEQETTEEGKRVFADVDGKRVIETVDSESGEKTYAYEDGSGDYTGDPADLNVVKNDEPTATGVMGALKLLSKSLQMVIDAEDDASAQDGYKLMNSTLDMFSDSLNTITTEQTKFGGVANRLEMSESTLSTNNGNLTAYLQGLNEVDYAQAVTQWMQSQYAYQASMQVSAASMNMSLLNYL